jgi:hypothetical protein
VRLPAIPIRQMPRDVTSLWTFVSELDHDSRMALFARCIALLAVLRARSASTKKLATLGALMDFFARVFDVPGKTRTVIARCLKIVCSTRHDIAADPEP